MKTKLTPLALLLAIGSLTPVAFAQEKEKTTETKTTIVEEKVVVAPEKGSISASLGDSATFSILTKALAVTGLDTTLGSKGAFTIFAPTDEAFSKLPEGTIDTLMLPENKEKLRSLLLYHVLPGTFSLADLKNGEIKTMNGEKIEVDIKSDTKQVEDSKIASGDLVATNGIIHSVDKVMVPKSLDGFAKLKEK